MIEVTKLWSKQLYDFFPAVDLKLGKWWWLPLSKRTPKNDFDAKENSYFIFGEKTLLYCLIIEYSFTSGSLNVVVLAAWAEIAFWIKVNKLNIISKWIAISRVNFTVLIKLNFRLSFANIDCHKNGLNILTISICLLLLQGLDNRISNNLN